MVDHQKGKNGGGIRRQKTKGGRDSDQKIHFLVQSDPIYVHRGRENLQSGMVC